MSQIEHLISGSPCKQQMLSSSSVAACGWHSNIRLPERNWKGKGAASSRAAPRGRWVPFSNTWAKASLKSTHGHAVQNTGVGLLTPHPYCPSKESLSLGKISGIIGSNLWPLTTSWSRAERHIQLFLEHLHGQGANLSSWTRRPGEQLRTVGCTISWAIVILVSSLAHPQKAQNHRVTYLPTSGFWGKIQTTSAFILWFLFSSDFE